MQLLQAEQQWQKEEEAQLQKGASDLCGAGPSC
jgi:hypothetical protein